ncbi:MAG: InlB B-repeat-containing protein [Opitutaceae bacterium]|nr:InlB B-repeat-containing protein [Opitutaceae bacterium]
MRVPLAGLPAAEPGETLEFLICVSWTNPVAPAPEHCVFECDNIVLTGAVEDITVPPPPPPENTVTITFDPNGGALGAQPASKEVTRGEPYGALPAPTRPNHAFRGWWTTAAGTGAQIVAGDTVPADAAAQTLYAKWEVTGSPEGADGAAALAGNIPQTNISGALDSFKYYKINVPAGAVNLTITTAGGAGDCNLYIKPPGAAGYELVGDEEGNNETITIAAPVPGEWNIFLHAYEPYTGVTLTAVYAYAAGAGGSNNTGGGGGGGAPGAPFCLLLALLAALRCRVNYNTDVTRRPSLQCPAALRNLSHVAQVSEPASGPEAREKPDPKNKPASNRER